MRSRIAAVSFFYSHNFCMDDVIIMKFGQNVQDKIFLTHL